MQQRTYTLQDVIGALVTQNNQSDAGLTTPGVLNQFITAVDAFVCSDTLTVDTSSLSLYDDGKTLSTGLWQ